MIPKPVQPAVTAQHRMLWLKRDGMWHLYDEELSTHLYHTSKSDRVLSLTEEIRQAGGNIYLSPHWEQGDEAAARRYMGDK